jgi:hypothetical protein
MYNVMQKNTTVYYAKPYAEVEVLNKEKAILITWNGTIGAKEYKDTWEAAYLATIESGFGTVISDTQKGGIVPNEIKEWLLKVFAPSLAKVVRNICVVISDDRNRVTFSDEVRKKTENLFVFYYFDTCHEAKEWAFTC